MIGFGEREAQILINFGDSPFGYNIASHDWGTDPHSPRGGVWKSSRDGHVVALNRSELAS